MGGADTGERVQQRRWQEVVQRREKQSAETELYWGLRLLRMHTPCSAESHTRANRVVIVSRGGGVAE